MAKQGQTLRNIETLTWQHIRDEINLAEDCILENTGTLYRLSWLWLNIDPTKRFIYTVKFVAPMTICQQRAHGRKREPIPGYDLDDGYGIELEEEALVSAPFNLIVDASASLDELKLYYPTIETAINMAKECFNASKYGKCLGSNLLESAGGSSDEAN